jgi:sugar lactone lactonase YvrE
MTPSGQLRRTWAGGPPSGQNMGKVFGFSAAQNGRPIPVRVDYDKVIWSGLSWAVGEINLKDLTPGTPILLRFHSAEKDPIKVKCTAYLVEY